MYEFSPVSEGVSRLKECYRNFPFTLDSERALIVTDTYKKHEIAPAPHKKPRHFTMFAVR